MQEYGDRIMQQMQGSDIVLKSDDIELGSLLGHGTFGAVYAGTLGAATPVALKEAFAYGLDQAHAAQAAIQEAIHEASVLHKLKHPNIVQVRRPCPRARPRVPDPHADLLRRMRTLCSSSASGAASIRTCGPSACSWCWSCVVGATSRTPFAGRRRDLDRHR